MPPKPRRGLKKRILRYRREHPFASLREMGRKMNVTHKYVWAVLDDVGEMTNAPKLKKTYNCKECNELMYKNRQFCSNKCAYKYRHIVIKCNYCQISFIRNRSIVDNKRKRGYNKDYCSGSCYQKARLIGRVTPSNKGVTSRTGTLEEDNGDTSTVRRGENLINGQ